MRRYRTRFAAVCLTAVALAAPAAAGEPVSVIANYPADKFQAWFNKLTQDGWVPTAISGMAVGDQPRFAAIAVRRPDVKKWVARFNLTPDQYGTVWEEQRQNGLRPTVVTGYVNGDAAGMAGVWVKDEAPRKWASYRGMATDRMIETINAQKAKGMMPVSVAGYTVGSAPRFSVILNADTGVAGWATQLDMTRAELARYVAEQKKEGYRPISLSGYQRGDQTRFCALLVKDSTVGWYANWNMSYDDLKREVEKRATDNAGYVPRTLCGFYVGDQVRYAAVWTKGE